MATRVLRRISAVALGVFLAGCSSLPSPSTSASAFSRPSLPTSSSPHPSAAPSPKVTCERLPVHAVLTCQGALAAAEAAIAQDGSALSVPFHVGDGRITSIEFHYLPKCPPGVYCTLFGTTRDGFVLFHFTGGFPVLWVQLHIDEAGRITATSPAPLPSPSSS